MNDDAMNDPVPAGRFDLAHKASGTPWAHALLLLGAAGAVFLAAEPQGSLGIFLVLAGLALVAFRPVIRISLWLWVWAGALVACASLSFLPSMWFPLPAWRKALESAPLIPLPGSITPIPAQTAFWVALLAGSVVIGLFALAQPLRSRSLLLVTLAATLVCGTYAALAIYAKITGWHYPFEAGATFGFFPNRNHTATFLVTGSLLGIGIVGVALRNGRWLTGACAGICLTTCVAGLFCYSSSRGGIVFLLTGTLIWIFGLGRTHQNRRLVVSFVCILLAGSAFFLVSGGEARERLVTLFRSTPAAAPRATADSVAAASEGGATLDERVLIYRDTLPMVAAFPLTGTGLGAFAAVFPQYRNASMSDTPAIHPESDWLMLAAEAGIPAVVCVAMLIGLAVRRLTDAREHPYWPLRWGCLVAAAAGALHGLVDVPLHRVPLGWWILVLAGLGLQTGRPKSPVARSHVQHALFVLAGGAMLILGVLLIRAQWFGGTPLPPFANDRRQAEIAWAYEQHDYEKAVQLDRAAITDSPMAETYYYQLGALELPFADSDAEVMAAFTAERLLAPTSAEVPLRQGDAWMHYDAARTVALWLEALSLKERIDRVAGAGPAAGVSFYRDLVERTAKRMDLQRALLAGSDEGPAFALAWLECARPALVKEQIAVFAGKEAFLSQLSTDEKRRFLLVWYAKADRLSLAEFIDANPTWQDIAWPVHLRQYLDAQDFERAVRDASTHYGVSLVLPPPGEESGAFSAPVQEQLDPVAAFNTYWRQGNTLSARRVLDESGRQGTRPVPPEIWRLKAALAAQKPDWVAAWQDLRVYIQAQRGEDPLQAH